MVASFTSSGATTLLPSPRRTPKPSGGWTGPPPDDSSGGHGDGGGDGADDGGGFHAESADLGSLALGLAMGGITVLFAVLIAVWLLLRRPAPDWPLPGPAGAVRTLWLSTACLVASSIAVELAARRTMRGREARRDARRWLVASLVLGLAFLGAQLQLWSSLWSAGLVPSSSGYAAVLFALTGLHALHVLGGLGYLGNLVLALRSRRPGRLPNVRLGATYWHFMGAIWLVLFGMLTFLR
jgi:cytochrome c oxidase subunit 3